MLQTIVLSTHVFVALAIIALVLLQRGKGADAGTGFGAGASGTVFGARGSASFLSRATGLLATLFFITSLALAYLATQRTAPESLLQAPAVEQSTSPAVQPAPAAPAQDDELPALPPNEPGKSSTDEGN
jgi:preprotein translocase subunit SecG